MKKLAKVKITVFGLGGVGSYAVEALVRSGVSNLKIVDFDKISITNINRQMPAYFSTIGKPKVDVVKEILLDINPELNLETCSEFCAKENREQFLKDSEFIVDAIDSLNPKVSLLEDAFRRKIEIISVMGAAGRINPEKIKICDISETYNCPLAKKVRKMLKRRGIEEGIKVVFSDELPKSGLPRDQCEYDNEAPFRGRDRNIQPSIAYIPAIMGLWAASSLIRRITENNF